MTVIPFPNHNARRARVSEQACQDCRRAVAKNRQAAATLCKSGLTMWLTPALFWLTVLDRISTDEDGE